MDLYSVKTTKVARFKKKRVGRGIGSGMGKTSTRGHKGQGARTSPWGKIIWEGGQTTLASKMPLRGFTNAKFKVEYGVINVSDLAELGIDKITPEVLYDKGFISKSQVGSVKVLGNGELKKKLDVEAHAFSKSAEAKIKAAGGKTTVRKK